MFDEAIKLIERHMKAEWSHVEVHVAYDGIEYKPEAGDKFIRLMYSQVDTVMVTVGSPNSGCYREHGLLTAQVHTPKGGSSIPCATYAREVGDIYRGWNSGSLHLQSPRIIRIGEVEEHFRYDTQVPFYYDYNAQSL